MGSEVAPVSENFDFVETCAKSLFPSQCGPKDEDIVWIKITEGYLALVVSIFGFIGNIMSLVVLFDQPLLDLFNKLLISLSICDLTFLSKFKHQ